MICSDHKKICFFHFRKEFSELDVKTDDLLRIALHISAMSPKSVKIDEIRKADTLPVISPAGIDRLLHSVDGGLRLYTFRDPAGIEDIRDLSDGKHVKSRFLQRIKRCGIGRAQRKVMTVGGPDKFTAVLPDIGPGDDASDSPLVPHGDLTGILTDIVEILKTERFLVPADLKDRIGGSVYDHLVIVDFILRILVKNDRTAAGRVADDFTSALFLEQLYEFRRKSGIRKCDEGLRRMDTHHLPVACHCIFAVALLRHPARISERSPGRPDPGKRFYIGDSH